MASREKSGRTGLSSRSSSIDVRRPRGGRTAGRKPGAWRRWLARILVTLVVLLVLGAGSTFGLVAYYSQGLPDVASLRTLREPQITRVVDRDGETIGEIFTERRTVVPLERIPRVLVLSVLAAEDADFYRHEGLDYPGLVRAVAMGVLSGGHFRGTSTITQQVVKNLLLTPERSFGRKVRELILARQLEEQFSKDEILELYLNHINFGHGRYGVQEAARYYFGCDVSELTLAQASLMAGIPQSPTHLSPRTHPEAARRRQRFVLDQLEEKRDEYWPDLSLEDIRQAREAHVELAPLPEAREAAPEIVDIARHALTDVVGEEAAHRGGYVVHTSIDVDLQTAARTALQEGLRAYDHRQSIAPPFRRTRPPRGQRTLPALPHVEALHVGATYDASVTGRDDDARTITLDVGGHTAVASMADLDRYAPDGMTPTAFVEEGARLRASILSLPDEGEEGAHARARLELGPEGAIVVIDPRTRGVLALVGAYEAGAGFDRSTRALRQPGSTFKPILYGYAIHAHTFTPASIVIDAPGVYDQWQPHNFETWEFHGQMRLRDALASSVNQVAVRVMESVTPEAVVPFAQELGITTHLDPSLALALGASEVRPIELCNAYATFAAGGTWSPYRIVTRIEDASGQEIALPTPEASREVMTPAEAYVLTSMLTSVVSSGTATAAQALHRPIAGKTGTSNSARDAWFAGYTPDTVAVVWVGFDDMRALGRRESGARSALPIWMDVIRHATEGRPAVAFPEPPGVVHVAIDPATGLLPYDGETETLDEVFVEGTQPTETAHDAHVLDTSSFLMQEFEEDQGADAGTAP
ncbi:MAG: PBP1A family penicillin-binding protein [Sandaracinus sp.]